MPAPFSLGNPHAVHVPIKQTAINRHLDSLRRQSRSVSRHSDRHRHRAAADERARHGRSQGDGSGQQPHRPTRSQTLQACEEFLPSTCKVRGPSTSSIRTSHRCHWHGHQDNCRAPPQANPNERTGLAMAQSAPAAAFPLYCRWGCPYAFLPESDQPSMLTHPPRDNLSPAQQGELPGDTPEQGLPLQASRHARRPLRVRIDPSEKLEELLDLTPTDSDSASKWRCSL